MAIKLYIVGWEDAVIGEKGFHHAIVSAYNADHAKALVVVERPHAYDLSVVEVNVGNVGVHTLDIDDVLQK